MSKLICIASSFIVARAKKGQNRGAGNNKVEPFTISYRISYKTDQKAKNTHPAGLENTSIPQFVIKITEIPQEKLTNTANPNAPQEFRSFKSLF